MKKKNYLTLGDDFIQYCKINNIDNIEKKAKEVFKKGFDLEKYGMKPILENVGKNTNIKESPVILKSDVLPPQPSIKKNKDDLYD